MPQNNCSFRHRQYPIANAINPELSRQQNQIELIASENIVSKDVLAAQGAVLTDKYAQGYPGRRYYGGCHRVRDRDEMGQNLRRPLANVLNEYDKAK